MLESLAHDVATASPKVWGIIIAAGVAALLALFQFGRLLPRLRLIENTPESRIRSAAQGFVELRGIAHPLPGETTKAELTGRPCVWFSWQVDRRHRDADGKGGTRWVRQEGGESSALFELRDGDAHCLVDPDGAEIIAVEIDTWHGNAPRPERGPAPTRSVTGLFADGVGNYRYIEQRLAIGRSLHVWGEFSSQVVTQDQGPTVTSLLRAWKADQATLVRRFDANRDGEVDAAEWDAARIAARRTVALARARAPVAAAQAVVGQPRASAQPFMISALPQASLLSDYRMQVYGYGALFFVAGAACVWMAGVRLAG